TSTHTSVRGGETCRDVPLRELRPLLLGRDTLAAGRRSAPSAAPPLEAAGEEFDDASKLRQSENSFPGQTAARSAALTSMRRPALTVRGRRRAFFDESRGLL